MAVALPYSISHVAAAHTRAAQPYAHRMVVMTRSGSARRKSNHRMRHGESSPAEVSITDPDAGASPATASISLRQLLMSLGEPLVELQAAPAGLDVEIRSVALLDPEDPPVTHPGELVLAIGARGRAAFPALRVGGRDGAAAVVVKLDAPGQAAALSATAVEAGIALLSVRGDARWEQVEALARAALDDAPQDRSGDGADEGNLFSLAQSTAVLTGGIVSIEDAANRVVAYSRSNDSDEVDDLRRRSILGWQSPEAYQARLRKWGVFQRLRACDEVISIDSHPELGIRRRLAVAIRSGDRQLGTIWVQEGSVPLTERSEQALLGAARVAALHLVRRRWELSEDLTLTRTLSAGLLEGSTGPQPLATHLGLDVSRPAAVLGFSYGIVEATGPELTRAEITNLVSVHTAAAQHRHRHAARLGGRDHRRRAAPSGPVAARCGRLHRAGARASPRVAPGSGPDPRCHGERRGRKYGRRVAGHPGGSACQRGVGAAVRPP
jgi:hypothetical protein